MARRARLEILGQLHLVQCDARPGVRFTDAEMQDWRHLAMPVLQAHEVAVHAWGMYPDRLKLVITPAKSMGLSRALQALGRLWGAQVMRRLSPELGATPAGAEGLWAGRYRSTVAEAPVWGLRAMVWAESPPANLGLDSPVDWDWSSAKAHMGRVYDKQLRMHALEWSLGNTPFERERAFRSLHDTGLTEADRIKIDKALKGAWPLGGEVYLQELQRLSSAPLRPRAVGRPLKTVPNK